MRPRPFADAFGPAARRRAARFIAESGRPLSWPHGRNGKTQITVDRNKLARFSPARARVAQALAEGGGTDSHLSGGSVDPFWTPLRRSLGRRRVERREILSVKDLSIHFGGVRALEQVSLTARTAEIEGVIGPNGAGKTTLFNCLSGLLTPDAGEIVFDGQRLHSSPAVRARKGLGRTFQTPRLFRSLSVADNLKFGCRAADMAGRDYVFDPSLRRLAHAERVERIAAMVGFRAPLSVPAGSLAFGDLRTVELARALCGAPSLLMLDEPASGLDLGQAEDFVTLLRSLSDLGLAILLIEHDMSLVMDVCNYITVLDFGQVIAEGTPVEVQANEAVIEAYLGRSA